MGIREASKQRGWARWLYMLVGTIFLASGVGGVLLSGLGTSPIDALVYGLSVRMSLSLTLVSIVVSLIFLGAAWFFGGIRPGPGTAISMLLFGPLLEGFLWLSSKALSHPVAEPGNYILGGTEWFFGAVSIAVGSALMITANLGVGAYDAATLAIKERLSWGVPTSRLVLDVSVLVLALIVGGPIGLGTVALAVLVPLLLRVALPCSRYGLIRMGAPVPPR